jgi:type IV secretion system protein VirD4
MQSTKILWGQIIVVFAIVLLTTWTATQWTAWRLGYQPQLGQPWFELARGVPVYIPPAFFWWWFAFDAYAPDVFFEGALIAASGGVTSIACAIGMSLWRAREPGRRHLWLGEMGDVEGDFSRGPVGAETAWC